MSNFFDAFPGGNRRPSSGRSTRSSAASQSNTRRSQGTRSGSASSARYREDPYADRYAGRNADRASAGYREERYDSRYDDARYDERRDSGRYTDRYEEGYYNSGYRADRDRDLYAKQDELLNQINDFRNRAGQLQELIANREQEADALDERIAQGQERIGDLNDAIADREDQIGELQEDLDTGLARFDGMLDAKIDEKFEDGFGFKFDSRFADTMDGKFEEVKRAIAEANNQTLSGLKDEIRGTLTETQQESLDALGERIEALKEVTDKIDDLDKSVKNMDAKIEEKLGGDDKDIAAKIIEARDDLSDKIHAEDVKCFRNMQVLIEEQNTMFESVEVGEHTKKFINLKTNLIAFITMLDTAGIIFLILYTMKIIRF